MAAPAKKNGRVRRAIDHARFVKEWQIAQSVEDVCQRMELPRHIVNATAKKLRDAGVKLKAMRRDVINVQLLNNIIDETDKS